MKVEVRLKQNYEYSSHAYVEDFDACCERMERAFNGLIRASPSSFEQRPLGKVPESAELVIRGDRLEILPNFCPWCGAEIAVEIVEVEEPEVPECHYCSKPAQQKIRHRVPEDEASMSEKGFVRVTTRAHPDVPSEDERNDTVTVTRFACKEHVDEYEVVS